MVFVVQPSRLLPITESVRTCSDIHESPAISCSPLRESHSEDAKTEIDPRGETSFATPPNFVLSLGVSFLTGETLAGRAIIAVTSVKLDDTNVTSGTAREMLTVSTAWVALGSCVKLPRQVACRGQSLSCALEGDVVDAHEFPLELGAVEPFVALVGIWGRYQDHDDAVKGC